MAIYSLAQRTTNGTITQAMCELRTGTPRVKLMEHAYTTNVGTAQSLGLGRPAAQGITPVNVAFQAEDPSDAASATNVSLSWATSPTVPAQFFRRWSLPATVGAGWIVTFPRGLVIAGSASLVIWNITAAQVGDIWHLIDE